MPRRTYAQVADVQAILPEEIAEKLSTPFVNPDLPIQNQVTSTNMNEYLVMASEEIDSFINQIYQVPIRRIKEMDSTGTFETIYPEPIVNCCAYIAASLFYSKLFGENQQPDTMPKYAENYRAIAMKYLESIREGDTILKGQVQLGKRYARGESREAPKTPWDKKPLGGN